MSYIAKTWDSLKNAGSRLAERFPFITRKWFYIPLALVVLGVAAYAAFSEPEPPMFETATVERQTVVQTVSETGTVEPAQDVDLSFTGTGRIQQVYVTEGERVRAGQLIATLESGRQYADLLAARARLKQAEASAHSGTQTHEQTEAQQDQYVENAERELLSGDLQAYLIAGGSDSSSRDFTPPTVSGTYRCEREGAYRIDVYSSAAQSGGSFHFSGPETGTQTISTVQPLPLGTCGLYIQFPDDFARGGNVVWEIPVPNVRSSTYQSRLNAYNAAVENRRLALEQSETSPILSAQVEEARAAVIAAEAAFADTRLVAPFSGLVTNVDAVRGDIASMGTPAASVISDQAFQIKVLIPEDDIGEIQVGDRATVTFDAYDDASMAASVSFISPRATTESGAAQFEVTLQFLEADERIRAGLSVDVDIIAAEAVDVIAVSTRAIQEEDDVRYVRVMTSETSFKRAPVTTGLSGDGVTEIRSGLTEGEIIITFANDEGLATLTEE